jgi:hypothetical protein
VVRLATRFELLYMGPETALQWKNAGGELRNYSSYGQARIALAEWKASSAKQKLFLVGPSIREAPLASRSVSSNATRFAQARL